MDLLNGDCGDVLIEDPVAEPELLLCEQFALFFIDVENTEKEGNKNIKQFEALQNKKIKLIFFGKDKRILVNINFVLFP